MEQFLVLFAGLVGISERISEYLLGPFLHGPLIRWASLAVGVAVVMGVKALAPVVPVFSTAVGTWDWASTIALGLAVGLGSHVWDALLKRYVPKTNVSDT